MPLAQSLLPEFDQEMANTRKVLERVPEDRIGWKPHGKSFSLGDLALHLANLPSWVSMTMGMTELDLNPPGGTGFQRPTWSGLGALVSTFDENAKTARAAIAGAADADFHVGWTLKNEGHALFTMPRVAVLRSMVFNHIIHHRGQFTVYLRLNDVPVPGLYGPSADEPM